MRYAFIKAHQSQHVIRLLCQAAHVHRSGYYAWLQQPQSLRTKEDKRLLGLIKRSWTAVPRQRHVDQLVKLPKRYF